MLQIWPSEGDILLTPLPLPSHGIHFVDMNNSPPPPLPPTVQGIGCYGCYPTPGVGLNFGCPVVEDHGFFGTIGSWSWGKVQWAMFEISDIEESVEKNTGNKLSDIVCWRPQDACEDVEEDSDTGTLETLKALKNKPDRLLPFSSSRSLMNC
jgi:hypothetical protein